MSAAPRIAGIIVLGFVLQLISMVGVVAQEPPATLPPLQVVVLVDESGSLSETDVVREREAARTIAFSVLAPGSVVSVVGFGSSNGPGQSAVHVVCPPTTLDAAQKRDSLATCVGGLHRRAKEEGDGTDHVAALQQALAFVSSGGPDKKVVFLLTDGRLDVSESPSWGDTPARRNGAAAAKVKEVLDDLAKAGVQVWPLGFGKVDAAALHDFAKGKSCTPAAPDPHDTITPTSAELTKAVSEAFSSASCAKQNPPSTGNLPKGGSVDLTIDIPAVASDASILVYKRDPRVQVQYIAPGASKPVPATGGSHFEFAGQATETESLRITDPEPGIWTVHLTSADVPSQDVAATVVYQAAVKAYLTTSPPQPAAGQEVDVNMQVWARGRAVTDQQTLQGLTFSTTLTGSTGFPAQQITLTDPDHDGTFAGRLKVPDGTSGDLTFTGQVTGIGIGGDTRVLNTKIQAGAAEVETQIKIYSGAVNPGGTVTGAISVNNNSGQPLRLRLEITDPSPGTVLTVDPAVVSAAAGVTETPFTLRFGADTPLGSSAATLRLVDEANPSRVFANRLLATQIVREPPLVEKLLWLWVVLAVLLAGGLVYLLVQRRARNELRKVRGLRAQLFQGGFVASDLEPRDPNSRTFAFVLHDDFTGVQLQPAGPGELNVYRVHRDGPNISFTPPGGSSVLLAPGERREIGRDLAIAILDERGLAGAGPTVGGPVAEVSYNPFGDQISDAPGPPANAYPNSYVDPFASSYGDPFAGTPTPQAPTTTYPPPAPAPDQPSQPGHAPPAGDGYLDPNNPFR